MDELALYEKRLVRALNCPKPMRMRCLKSMRDAAEEFRAENPELTWDQVEEYLGDPGELARTMLERVDQDALERYRKRKRWLKRAAVIALAAAFLLSLAAAIYINETRKIPVILEVTETLIIGEEQPLS